MDTEVKDQKTDDIVAAPEAVETPEEVAPVASPSGAPGERRRGGRERRGRRSPSARPPRARSEFDQRIINIRRVARVVSGGRRFSFSVAIIIGNKKGKVGVGVGKAGDTSLAIDKAVRSAKKSLITLPLTSNSSIPHEVSAKFCASRVSIMPVKGRGLVAGSSIRSVLELAGITDVIAKLHSGSKNGLNNARSAIEALKTLKV
ncbi:MAG: 30S ribosomal protein S5 [Patescibacteria group bacterium]|nr:30S ribosomal protein S5 [Patescibacteria group bacterium]